MRQTKIVSTVGPACDSEEALAGLIQAGVNVIRLNMKHADRQYHDDRIARIRSVCKAKGLDVSILIDLQGPEVRIETTDKQEIAFQKDETVRFVLEFSGSNPKEVKIPTPEAFANLKVGQIALIDDGAMELAITEVGPDYFLATLKQDCVIKHRKSINFPGAVINLPSMTADDYLKLDMANIQQVDIVALSFTRTKGDIEILRNELDKRQSHALICAKIENQEALDHLDEIVAAADLIMVARGDLAVEIPFERLAYEQKRIIKACNDAGKPVITATQMLHSMVHELRPTRAEICDVANAVYDQTTATMTSEETAAGEHPLLVVETMARIITYTETVAPRDQFHEWVLPAHV